MRAPLTCILSFSRIFWSGGEGTAGRQGEHRAPTLTTLYVCAVFKRVPMTAASCAARMANCDQSRDASRRIGHKLTCRRWKRVSMPRVAIAIGPSLIKPASRGVASSSAAASEPHPLADAGGTSCTRAAAVPASSPPGRSSSAGSGDRIEAAAIGWAPEACSRRPYGRFNPEIKSPTWPDGREDG